MRVPEQLHYHFIKTARFNNNFSAWLSFTSADALKGLITITDMGAAPIVIHQNPLPGLKTAPLAQRSVGIKDAGGHALKIRGTTVMTISIADHMARVPFLVVECQIADEILGCYYIDKHIDAIYTRKRVLYMFSHSSVPIYRRPASILASHATKERSPKAEEGSHLQVSTHLRRSEEPPGLEVGDLRSGRMCQWRKNFPTVR